MLETLIENAQALPSYHLEDWHPVFKGDMDLVIKGDGVWLHEGSPIVRDKIRQLFGRLLQRQANGDYWIVTPVEAFRIQVEDLPFVIVAVDLERRLGQDVWVFTSNLGDQITLLQQDQFSSGANPLAPSPQLHVRDDLWGRINRSVFYQLALASEIVASSDGDTAQLRSGGQAFSLGPV